MRKPTTDSEIQVWARAMKYTMATINIAALILGLSLVVVSALVLLNHSYLQDLIGSTIYRTAALVLVVLGSAVTLVAILGYAGAVKEARCLLMTYCIMTSAILISIVSAGVVAYYYRFEMVHQFRVRLQDSFPHGGQGMFREAWDLAQAKLGCCGVNGYRDWQTDKFNSSLPEPTLPWSCCRPNEHGSTVDCRMQPTEETAYLDGCLYSFIAAACRSKGMLSDLAIVFIFIVIMSGMFSCALFRTIGPSYYNANLAVGLMAARDEDRF